MTYKRESLYAYIKLVVLLYAATKLIKLFVTEINYIGLTQWLLLMSKKSMVSTKS